MVSPQRESFDVYRSNVSIETLESGSVYLFIDNITYFPLGVKLEVILEQTNSRIRVNGLSFVEWFCHNKKIET